MIIKSATPPLLKKLRTPFSGNQVNSSFTRENELIFRPCLLKVPGIRCTTNNTSQDI